MIYICFRRIECLNDAFTICSPTPFDIIGKICQKSPPRTIVIPPNGFSQSQISRCVRSTASTQCLCCIGTSSQIMSFVSLNNSACNDCLLNPLSEFFNTSYGMENVECAVRPSTNSNDAIPNEATTTSI